MTTLATPLKTETGTLPTIQSWWSDWKASLKSEQPQDRFASPDNDQWASRLKPASMQHIPLSSAYLCQDCNSIGNCASCCPACASEVLLSLAGVLNREPEPRIELNLVEMAAA